MNLLFECILFDSLLYKNNYLTFRLSNNRGCNLVSIPGKKDKKCLHSGFVGVKLSIRLVFLKLSETGNRGLKIGKRKMNVKQQIQYQQ